MKKLGKFLAIGLSIIVLLIIVVMLLPEDEVIVNEGTDTYTLMIYMCASDLESDGGYATNDISEMLNATVDEKINLIIETGGTKEWQNYGISNKTNQIYKIENNELKLIKDDLGIKEMTKPETLTEFIQYCKSEYPADKYGLILWDHGGGAVSGFGYDEHSKNEEDTLTIDKLKKALKESETKFEFIGFDACLMANIETAYSIKDYAKYLIASEETEPGTGWEYKSFLNKMSKNTSEDTLEIAKTVVDNFIESNNGIFDFEDATLSVIDLRKIDGLYKTLSEFMKKIESENLDKNQFATVSKAIGKTKAFAEGEYDIIDLSDFASKINNDKSQELINKIKETVVYYQNTDLVDNTYGISIYIPYNDLSYYEDMLKIYKNIGIKEEYTKPITKFVNQLAGGKEKSYKINSHTYSTDVNYDEYNWYDEDIINENQDAYKENEYEELEIIDKGDYYALEISEADWNKINNITCEVMYDDGEGYIDLGSDDYFETDADENLKITFDGYWVSINNQIVPFYTYESTDKYSKGKVRVLLNEEEASLIVVWDEKNPDGIVIGAEIENQYGDTTINSKGLKKIKKGDKIEFICDYYTYEGKYEDSYIFGEELIVGDEGLTVSYEEITDGTLYVYYKITDVYNNTYYTEAVIFKDK